MSRRPRHAASRMSAALLAFAALCSPPVARSQPPSATTPPKPASTQSASRDSIAPTKRSIGGEAAPVRGTVLPKSVQQGALVIGRTHPSAVVEYGGRRLRVSPNGLVAVLISAIQYS